MMKNPYLLTTENSTTKMIEKPESHLSRLRLNSFQIEKKGQKLTHNQRVQIFKQIKVDEVPSSVVSYNYCLGISTIKRIIKYFDIPFDELEHQDEEIRSKIFVSKKVTDIEKGFVHSQNIPIRSKDV